MVVTRFSLSFPRPFRWAGSLLGFSLGSLFDALVLNQALPWHHPWSAYDPAAGGSAPLLFALLMYAVAGLGLWGWWHSRGEHARPRATQVLAANALVGFGTWHALDGLLVHGLLGWHHIRMDVANPVPWDLAWLTLFSLAPLVAGWWLRQRIDRVSASASAAKAQR